MIYNILWCFLLSKHPFFGEKRLCSDFPSLSQWRGPKNWFKLHWIMFSVLNRKVETIFTLSKTIISDFWTPSTLTHTALHCSRLLHLAIACQWNTLLYSTLYCTALLSTVQQYIAYNGLLWSTIRGCLMTEIYYIVLQYDKRYSILDTRLSILFCVRYAQGSPPDLEEVKKGDLKLRFNNKELFEKASPTRII